MGKTAKELSEADTFTLLSPSFVLVLLFFLLPVGIIALMSFTNLSTDTGFDRWRWVGLSNYAKILAHPNTGQHLWITLKYVAVTLVFFNVGLGLGIALLTTSVGGKTGAAFRALWLLPRITPSVIYVLMWKYLGADAPYGLINTILVPLGVAPQNWVAAQPFLFVVLVNGFIGASFGMIIFTAAIEAIPRQYLRAAMLDGASYRQRVRHIILPMINWPLLFVVTFQTLSLLTSFEQILILNDGAGGMEVWSLWAYHAALNNYYGNFQWGFGAALAAVLVVIGVGFCWVYLKFFKFSELVTQPKNEDL
jgi:inositol-phosphate transport system permease protein